MRRGLTIKRRSKTNENKREVTEVGQPEYKTGLKYQQ